MLQRLHVSRHPTHTPPQILPAGQPLAPSCPPIRLQEGEGRQSKGMCERAWHAGAALVRRRHLGGQTGCTTPNRPAARPPSQLTTLPWHHPTPWLAIRH